MAQPRVVVVDDNPVVRSGLISLLEAGGIEVAAQAADGLRAVEVVERHRPDLVLLDVRMPLLDGVSAATRLSRTAPVLMLTYTDAPEVVRAAIGNGAVGYLVHGTFTPDELLDAVRRAAAREGSPLSPTAAAALVDALRGRPMVPAPAPAQAPSGAPGGDAAAARAGAFGLSARETEVMELIARGYSNGDIAAGLFVAEKTVKNHVNRIFAKLGVTSRGRAIARWLGTAQEDRR